MIKRTVKKAWESKIIKIALIGAIALTIFGGGAVSASYVLKTFDETRGQSLTSRIEALGENLLTEKAHKWFYKDEAEDKQGTITTLNGQITTLNDSIATLQAQIADMEQNGSPEQQENIATLQGQINAMQTEKTTLETNLANAQGDIQTLNSEIDQANQAMTRSEQKLAEYENLYNEGDRTNGGTPDASKATWRGVENGNDPDLSPYYDDNNKQKPYKNPAYEYDAEGNPIIPGE